MRIYGVTSAWWACHVFCILKMSSFSVDVKSRSLLRSEVLLPFQISLEETPYTPAESRITLCNPWCRSHLALQPGCFECHSARPEWQKICSEAQGSRDWLGMTVQKGNIQHKFKLFTDIYGIPDMKMYGASSACVNHGWSSLLRPFWTFDAAKSQKAGHLGLLHKKSRAACRCDTMITRDFNDFTFNHPQNGFRIFSMTQVTPCGPRVASIFQKDHGMSWS